MEMMGGGDLSIGNLELSIVISYVRRWSPKIWMVGKFLMENPMDFFVMTGGAAAVRLWKSPFDK